MGLKTKKPLETIKTDQIQFSVIFMVCITVGANYFFG